MHPEQALAHPAERLIADTGGDSDENCQQLVRELAAATRAIESARKRVSPELRRCYENARAAHARCLQHMDTIPPLSRDNQLMELWSRVGRVGAWIESVTPLVHDYESTNAEVTCRG